MGMTGETFPAVTTRKDAVVAWGQKNSLWPMPFGTACCAIEFMGVAASVFDIARFGAELVRFSPRQSDLLLVAGTVTFKQAPILKQIYEQMCEPKWVVAFGVCASTGGFYQNYSTMPGADQVVPVDVYIPGCPPRPEQVLDGLILLQERIQRGEGHSQIAIEAEKGYDVPLAAIRPINMGTLGGSPNPPAMGPAGQSPSGSHAHGLGKGKP